MIPFRGSSQKRSRRAFPACIRPRPCDDRGHSRTQLARHPEERTAMTRTARLLAVLAAVAVLAAPAAAEPAKAASGTKAPSGTVDLKSAGPLAVGPHGVLFVADPQAATVFAIETGDKPAPANGPVKMAKVDERIAGMLGTSAGEIAIADMVADPASGMVYVPVARG